MRVRKARQKDWPQARRLAQDCGLDYPGMEADEFWVAEEDGLVVGICGLKTHPDCRELCALGVERRRRGQGWGKRLVQTLIQKTGGDLYLATIIHDFFSTLGFKKAEDIPDSMIKDAEWCAGCKCERCTIMVREGN